MFEELTAVIVTFKSKKIIKKTLSNLPQNLKKIIVENSNDQNFKEYIEGKYNNIKCILAGENIGWGSATNIGIKRVETDFVLFLNPDLFVSEDVLYKIFCKIKEDKEIGVISPQTIDGKSKIRIRHEKFLFSKPKKKDLLQVQSLSGQIFISRKKNIENVGFLDEKIFLNFEERDLFKRISKKGQGLYIYEGIYAQHLEGRSSDPEHQKEMELSSKWHFSWGLIYYTRKHYGNFLTLMVFIKYLIIYSIKLTYFRLSNQKYKFKLISYSLSGLINSIFKKPSYYRPKID